MLDTDTCVAILKGDHQHISRKVLAQPLADVGISTVTLAELLTGVAKSEQSVQNAHALESLLSVLDVAAFDRTAAMIYGAIRARLESRNADRADGHADRRERDKRQRLAPLLPMATADRIVLDPTIAHGKPVIRGTRVPVTMVLGSLAGGDDV